ncbi:septum formation initiator family protein [Kitasatospora sp. GP82]|uniref:FtsB family cell division protein n=1 Tax=Kitasatospora sp. GP82 TaxID=3035089 RepID=UPI0024743A6E|nr:septum formation initiator family protein [Kitasatospora sp. GP82]MDH6123096.1 cell division protein FtsB [Kitasatospora sp. GP82]
MARWKIPGFAGRPRFTSRATVLVLVLCSLVAILAYPTRQFIAQRSEINGQRAKAQRAAQQVEKLRKERARWQDPVFVKAQARERLHYALPGETPFVSIDPSPPAAQPSAGAVAAGQAARAGVPWYTSVWSSVALADSPPDAAATVVTAGTAATAAPTTAPAPR